MGLSCISLKKVFLIFRERYISLAYLELEAYSEPWYIQNSKYSAYLELAAYSEYLESQVYSEYCQLSTMKCFAKIAT